MKDELAKQLKDAGFPQKEAQSWEDISETSPWENYMYTRNLKGKHNTFDSSIAGYKESEPDFFEQGKYRPSARFKREYLDSQEGKRLTVYFPTLSELIEACGDGFESLERHEYGSIISWWAWGWDYKQEFGEEAIGKGGHSPKEAVAKLWLELNKHES